MHVKYEERKWKDINLSQSTGLLNGKTEIWTELKPMLLPTISPCFSKRLAHSHRAGKTPRIWTIPAWLFHQYCSAFSNILWTSMSLKNLALGKKKKQNSRIDLISFPHSLIRYLTPREEKGLSESHIGNQLRNQALNPSLFTSTTYHPCWDFFITCFVNAFCF